MKEGISTGKILNDYKLKTLITIYEQETEYVDQTKYIELAHAIDGQVGAFRAASIEELSKLFLLCIPDEIKEKVENSIFINRPLSFNIVSLYKEKGNLSFSWLVPKRKKTIHLKKHDKTQIEIIFPDLVFSYHDGAIYIYVVKNTKIDNETELRLLPFPNISAEGRLCIGNVKTKYDDKDIYSIMTSIDNIFFQSYFNKDYMERKERKFNRVIHEFDGSDKKLPWSLMIKTNKNGENTLFKH
jgi:hypothetical protein